MITTKNHFRPSSFGSFDNYGYSSVSYGRWSFTQQSQTFIQILVMLKSRPEWDLYFRQLPQTHAMIAAHVTSRFHYTPDGKEQIRAPADLGRDNVNDKCANYTGKLRSCDACGKLETKRGDMSKCSRCSQIRYCSKECQIEHWHKGHKSDCKRLRKANN